MKVVLNEASLPNTVVNGEMESYISGLVVGLKFLEENKIGSNQIKFHLNRRFKVSKFGIKFFSELYTNYDWETQVLFTSLIDCTETEDLIQALEDATTNPIYSRVVVPFVDREFESIGLKAVSYCTTGDCVSYSFCTHVVWEQAKLPLKAYHTEDSFVKQIVLNYYETNLKLDFFIYDLIRIYLSAQSWKPSEMAFPFAKMCEVKHRELCQKEIDLCTLSSEKNSVYQKYGAIFCFSNGYDFDTDISNINSNPGQIRKIYSAGLSRRKRYISLDIENGGFELCDYDGTHLGTFGWTGEKITDAKIATHSIKIGL